MSITRKIAIAVSLAAGTLCHGQTPAKKFTIYAFVPYKDHIIAGTRVNTPQFDEYLESEGIHRVKVVYLNRFMTNDQPDASKIEDIARAATKESKIPVSFDTEFGDRFHPETVIPRVSQILTIYHQFNKNTPAGVYATAPQNTYAWNANIGRFDALNEKYAPIAQQVDFLSPVLYNYEGGDTEAWKQAAVYNMKAAQKYGTGKPILPYLGIVVRLKDGTDDASQKGRPMRMLTEEEMLVRLQTLYDLGADGCIVWASSGDRLDGSLPAFDRNSGWGKALADFARAHR
jgi:hypothetical protein